MPGKTVMVIEDNTDLRAMLAELLYASGYSVFSAGDATNACTMAQTLRPSVVLCDVVLPTTTGFEAAAQLRNDPQTRRIPVVLMSGRMNLAEHEPVPERWLNKPFTAAELTTALENAVLCCSYRPATPFK